MEKNCEHLAKKLEMKCVLTEVSKISPVFSRVTHIMRTDLSQL